MLASGFWSLLRSDGMDGEMHHYFAWRWAKTSEDRLIEKADNKLNAMPLDSIAMAKEAEWPGFSCVKRDDIIHGVLINTNWSEFHRLRCGAGQLDQAARPLLFTAPYSTLRTDG